MFNIYDEAIRSTELPKRVWLCLTAFFSRAIRPWHTLQQLHQYMEEPSTLSSPFSVFPRQPTSGIPTTHYYLSWIIGVHTMYQSVVCWWSLMSLFFSLQTPRRLSTQRSSRTTECSTGCSNTTVRLSNAFGKPRKQLAMYTSFILIRKCQSDEKIKLITRLFSPIRFQYSVTVLCNQTNNIFKS